MTATPQAIIFAINSAIRLGRNAQRAYAKSLTSKAIVLPLPAHSGEANAETAHRFFADGDPATGGKQYLAQLAVLADIHHRYETAEGAAFPTDEELKRYIDYYKSLSALLQNEAKREFNNGLADDRINADELVALLSIRQYTHDGAKHTSPLQLVAGTLVEIGIDYFNQVPGALNARSSSGKVLSHFLKALDDLAFSDSPKFKEDTHKIAPRLFIATAESLSSLNSRLTQDPKLQDFIEAAGKGIASDLYQRLATLDPDRHEDALRWGEFMLRACIANAGHYVLEAPQQVLGLNAGPAELVKATGNVLLEAILKDPHKLSIKDGMNADTLDRLLQTSFGVIAQHPYLIHHRNTVQEFVGGLAEALSKYPFAQPDLFPELLRIIMAYTGQHLQMIWQPDDEINPGIHAKEQLAFTAVQILLEELSAPIPGQDWRPRLGKQQLILLAETLLEEVIRHPHWITHRHEQERPLLARVLRSVLNALATIPPHERLSAQTMQWLVQVSLRTVASSEQVLTPLKWGDEQDEEAILQHALTLIFSFVFSPTPNQRIPSRPQLLAELVEYAMKVIIARHPDEKGLLLLQIILFKTEGVDYAGGFNRHLADSLINAALQAINTHPQLVTDKAALAQILAGVASALDASSFRNTDLLPELLRLTLQHTALHAALVVGSTDEDADYLVVVFIKELLLALSSDVDADGNWQPQLTPAEAITIVQTMLDTLIMHPEWLIKGEDGQLIFKDVMTAVRNALAELPASVRLNSQQLEQLLLLGLYAAGTSRAVLDKIPWGSEGDKRSVMEHALQLVGSFVFEDARLSGGERLERFAELCDFVLRTIISYYPDARGLLLVQLILFGNEDVDYSRGLDDELANEILESALRVIQLHPNLVSNTSAVQQIAADLAASLDVATLRKPGVLPELLRQTLEATALNAHLVVNAQHDSPRFLIAAALQDLLRAIASKEDEGRWKPTLTSDELLLITENLLEVLSQHPSWLLPPDEAPRSLYQDVLHCLLDALAKMPTGARLKAELWEEALIQCLYAAANSPALLKPSDEEGRLLLGKVLDIVVAHVFEGTTNADPGQITRFVDLLHFVLEMVINRYPDQRCLLLVELLCFQSGVDYTRPFDREQAERLVNAGLDILETHPELIAQEAVFQKILQDTAGALKASRTPMEHLLPEFFRLVLRYASGNLETLMRISPNSPRMLLAVALEQTLRVITRPPARGTWSPRLSEEQTLEIVELILARVSDNPQWMGSDKLVQLTLEALYNALKALRTGQNMPYAVFSVMVETALEAVGQRKQLVLVVVQPDGQRQQLVLEYALGSLFVKLYGENEATPASWALTQSDTLQTLISHYLLKLAICPSSQEAVDSVRQPIDQALDDINNNLAFTIEGLLAELDAVVVG